jgi:hexosaminidase
MRVLLVALACSAILGAAVRADELALVPRPVSVESCPGTLTLSDAVPIAVPAGDAGATATAGYLADLLRQTQGLTLAVSTDVPLSVPAIRFVRGSQAAEAYHLSVNPRGVVITASDDGGQFYGAVTLWQLMGSATLPCTEIDDKPRFAWRGLMLDSARHLQSVASIEHTLDWMALHKLNVFHWHLTDDQGWRIEIRKYPRLTEVGAWRVPAGAAGARDIDPKTGKPRPYGGFFTQDEARAVVKYASLRHITVLPEIDMPGHATAILAAYPEFGVPPNHVAAPGSDWGVYENVLNIADDRVLAFAEDVWDELMPIFPGVYLHVGGDEAQARQWNESPAVQARMKEWNIATSEGLQSRFVGKLATYLRDKGRRLIGWDEILNGTITDDATVMSWRGVKGALTAAQAGHDTVLAPDPDLYLDHRQSTLDSEPPGRIAVLSLKDIYGFDPLPVTLSDAERAHVLGLQAEVWTEHMRTEDSQTKMTWPRAAAVAEIAWTPPDRQDFGNFLWRLAALRRRYPSVGLIDDGIPPQEPTAPPTSAPGQLPAKRMSQDLAMCGGAVPLNLEGDWPIAGRRSVFAVDIFKPCWIYRAADLSKVSAIKLAVGQIPFNFQVLADRQKIKLPAPRTPEGELEVHLDDCAAPPIAVLPLKRVAAHPGLTTFVAPIKRVTGVHDVCLQATGADIDPLTVIDSVEFDGRRQKR